MRRPEPRLRASVVVTHEDPDLAVEEIARACATSSLILSVQGLGSLPILLGGSEEQKARLIPALASGDPASGERECSIGIRTEADPGRHGA